MKSFSYSLQQDPVDQPAVGLVVLQSDETMEHELRRWLPENVRLFHSRIPNDVVVTKDTLHSMKAALPAATALLPDATEFKVIVYGCTSGATVIGEQAVSDAVQAIFPGVAVTNPLSAVKAQLSAIDARRIALLTPYVPQVSAALIDALQMDNIEVIQGATFNESRDDRVARISRQSLQLALTELGQTSGIDAVFASCTNLRTFGLLDDVRRDIGVPVISSNSALAWHIQSLLS